MPLYEYKCQKCKNRFERIERASSQHDGVCPTCGGTAHRLLSAPALQFKGSGWYVNDYANGNGSRASESEKETATASATTTDTKSEKTSSAKVEKSEPKKADPKVA